MPIPRKIQPEILEEVASLKKKLDTVHVSIGVMNPNVDRLCRVMYSQPNVDRVRAISQWIETMVIEHPTPNVNRLDVRKFNTAITKLLSAHAHGLLPRELTPEIIDRIVARVKKRPDRLKGWLLSTE